MRPSSTPTGALAPPRLIPGRGQLPVLLSVPHAGRAYPDWLVRLARRGAASLAPLEDPLVDRLVWRAQALGIACVVADAPRAAIDCNRAEDELDPHAINLPPGAGHDGWRVRAGLGLIPARLAGAGDLWRRRIGPAELEARLDSAWRPYHRLLAEQLELLRRRHAEVLLLDCHSMPWRPGQAELVLGDRHGLSAAPFVAELARQTAEAAGYRTSRNDPYAGGQIVAAHGAPERGVHALQLELDRRCYLDPAGRAPGEGFDRSARLFEELARTLGGHFLDRNALPLAAE
ncbi:N-formylglutamate amidohydrolase [Sphingomonas astaxanthinifaciens]|uniref:N-formylglutamate amidohydrolase n=1 Tax=Sphingomonas astaxanthinifaciens DSM 22298 TaxID=1123267 RepID=A0ABQ5Z8T4_9SPHN|nr:N-formylglutamate amidohydrolase [Sphingomonas astaxanthinifaciens]GLR46987.1 N-formylglutamate amidohydrolase [Sphingomonas astaxanthinifaciens DSM 22298]